MNMKKILSALFKEIIHEAETNTDFRNRLESILAPEEKTKPQKLESIPKEITALPIKRPSNRRPPALLDPVHLARQGEEFLRIELGKLNLEQLRDVIADYGMDPGKLVLKWRDPERVIERIIEVSLIRAQKGSAFRDQPSVDSTVIEINSPEPSDKDFDKG